MKFKGRVFPNITFNSQVQGLNPQTCFHLIQSSLWCTTYLELVLDCNLIESSCYNITNFIIKTVPFHHFCNCIITFVTIFYITIILQIKRDKKNNWCNKRQTNQWFFRCTEISGYLFIWIAEISCYLFIWIV